LMEETAGEVAMFKVHRATLWRALTPVPSSG
jgi:hypothetical protein